MRAKMKKRWLPSLLLLTFLVLPVASAQDGPAPLPKKLIAVAPGADLRSSRTVSIAVSSRRDLDLVSPIRAEKFSAQMRKAVARTGFKPVDDGSTAQLSLELVVESHERWGPSHSQNNPYVFLLLRDRTTARLLYCGYKRVRFSYPSAAGDLLGSLADVAKSPATGATGDIRTCAAEAMRLPDVGL